MSKRKKNLLIINPNAAGIDISSKEHFVAVPADRDEQPVRKFESYTCDLHAIAKWLKSCEIETVAMESTGIYWLQLYLILEEYGFKVYLVNARHVKNVSGRKTDVQDCQWIQQLHSYGLLNKSFQPDNLTRELRTYVRQRKTLIEGRSRSLQHMQKALEQMNIKLHNVISDLDGKTGITIIEAILAGEREAERLSSLRDRRVKATKEEIIKSLEANWREDQLFLLKQSYEMLKNYDAQIADLDVQIESILSRFTQNIDEASQEKKDEKSKTKKRKKNGLHFDAETYLKNAFGTNVTNIDGIGTLTGLTILSEIGSDLSKFKSVKHFVSWLNLVPNNKSSGGEIISSRVMKKKNKAGQAFRMAAYTLSNDKGPLGDYIRRRIARYGFPKAIVATANKLAQIFYKIVTEKIEYSTEILRVNNQVYLSNKLKYLKKRIEDTKLELSKIQPVVSLVI